MWIFGYGSLMFDEWESNHGCVGRRWADLAGYRRVFNKKSVENWGSKKRPGLTLNLKDSTTSVCRGIAFEFIDDDSKSLEMLKRLTKREACQPRAGSTCATATASTTMTAVTTYIAKCGPCVIEYPCPASDGFAAHYNSGYLPRIRQQVRFSTVPRKRLGDPG
jgi:cation transport regulator ChaC